MIKLNYLINDPAQLIEDLFLVRTVAAAIDQAGSATNKALVLFGPLHNFCVQCTFLHFFLVQYDLLLCCIFDTYHSVLALPRRIYAVEDSSAGGGQRTGLKAYRLQQCKQDAIFTHFVDSVGTASRPEALQRVGTAIGVAQKHWFGTA